MITSICTLIGMSGKAEIAPATKSRESPGRKGVTTNPVSQKIIKKQNGIRPGMIITHNHNHILIDMKDEIQ